MLGGVVKNNVSQFRKLLAFAVTVKVDRTCQEARINRGEGLAAFLWLFLFAATFFSSYCPVCSGESLPAPQKDKFISIACPPAINRIPQGFLLNRRDLAFSVHFIDEKNGWIVGDCGLALKTTDGGESWQRVTILNKIFKDVFFVGEKGWIVGEMGLVLHTDDGGKSWKKQISNVGTSLMSVFFVDADKGITVGADGTMLRTEDGGVSWEVIPFDWMSVLTEDLLARGYVSVNLYHTYFTDENCGWIVGDYGTILNTRDGGKEWTVSHIGYFPALFSVSFKNEMEGFVVGQNGFFLKTDNGGENWETSTIKTEHSLYRIKINNDLGVIVGDEGTMFQTDNGGKTWVQIDTSHNFSPPYPWFNDTWILSDSSKTILSVGKSVILKTAIFSRK